jgi:four helix bundle protein
MSFDSVTGSEGSYKSLLVWQKSIVLVKAIYELTNSFPSDEKYGIVSQMRRAAVSIPSNIAEGQARRTTPDFIRFVSNAEGSIAELDTQMIVCVELGYCSSENVGTLFDSIAEIRRMLNGLRRSLMAKGGGR